MNGGEGDLHRDTNQRFWREFPSAAWEFTYTIKFLRSSIAFPLSVTFQGLEQASGTCRAGHTSFIGGEPSQSHGPMEPRQHG